MTFPLANILTMFRVVVLAPYVALFFMDAFWVPWALIGLFSIASLTDFLDGYVARKYNQMSDFGRFLDPIADKLLVLVTFIMLVATQALAGLHLVAVLLILSREILISGFREFLAGRVVVHVTRLAKWKTTIQLFAQFVLLLSLAVPQQSVFDVGLLLLWASAFLTVLTGYQYLTSGFRQLKS